MHKLLILTALLLTASIVQAKPTSTSKPKYYGAALCNLPQYNCHTVQGRDTWKRLWPDETQRDLVQRINRTDNRLHRGQKLAVPVDIANKTLFDVSPFPAIIKQQDLKLIVVDQEKLAWGAYKKTGQLVKWGPISSGQDYCRDIGRSCNTITGTFYVFNKKSVNCRSNAFPVGRGGSRMPYCMFFYKGYALHGSFDVPGHRDSHGCVRMFIRDAKWMNHNFIDIPTKENNFLGTKVVVQQLLHLKK